MSRRCIRTEIYGRVQGVWFRAWTEQEAKRHNLDGWVRNRRDGSVEAVFAGAPAHVEAMLSDCWNGPPAADVLDVQVFEADEPTAGFKIRNTE